jgi:Ser/Thr protein kinase RdoA (MazF antagonist)
MPEVITSKAAHGKNTVFDLTLATGQHLILKQVGEHTTPERLASEYRVLAHLHAAGVPVSLPLVSDEGGTFVKCDDHIYTLTPALPLEETFEPKKYPKLYENIGRAIGKLHKALANYPHEISSWTMDLPGRLKNENVLLYAGDVSGFIDLDHLPNGPRIYDLSYYLADRLKNLIDEREILVE